MDRTRVLIFACVIAAAMLFGGVLGATAFARTTLTPVLAAASPSPAHQFRGGLNGHPCGGHSNEDAAHEATESAAEEAAENAACPTPSP